MFDLGADADLQTFNLNESRPGDRSGPVVYACLAASRHASEPPLPCSAFRYPDIRRQRTHPFPAVQQRFGRVDVVNVGRSTDDGVHQPRVCIHADMRFHPEVPLISLLRLVYFRVSCTRAVLRRAGCRDRGSVDSRPCFKHQALLAQDLIDQREHLRSQAERFEQVAKPENRALVRQTRHPAV